MKTTQLNQFFYALSLDTHSGHISNAITVAINAIRAIYGLYGPYGYGRWQYQYSLYGYPVKEHNKTI